MGLRAWLSGHFGPPNRSEILFFFIIFSISFCCCTLVLVYIVVGATFRDVLNMWFMDLIFRSFQARQSVKIQVSPGLVIVLKLDSNHQFFSPCDLEIWWMTPKNNNAPLLCYFNLFASFRSHWWIQTGVTVWKRPIWVQIDDFWAVWPWNLTDDLEKIRHIS